MAKTSFLEDFRVMNALPPVANAFAGTVYPLGISMANLGRVCFVVQKGVGTTGTTTITAWAGDGSSPFNVTAIAFEYRRIPSNNVTPGAITAATTAGFTTTAGSSDTYLIEVDAKALAASGYKFCGIKMVESVASAVVGSVLIIAGQPRYADSTLDVTT